jgi:hypothetical protein
MIGLKQESIKIYKNGWVGFKNIKDRVYKSSRVWFNWLIIISVEDFY